MFFFIIQITYKFLNNYIRLKSYILSDKDGRSSYESCYCLGCLASTSNMYPLSLLSLQFFMKILIEV